MTSDPTPAAASEQPPDVSRHCPECERLVNEKERLEEGPSSRDLAMAEASEMKRLQDWLIAHESLWRCMSGSPVDVAIAIMSRTESSAAALTAAEQDAAQLRESRDDLQREVLGLEDIVMRLRARVAELEAELNDRNNLIRWRTSNPSSPSGPGVT